MTLHYNYFWKVMPLLWNYFAITSDRNVCTFYLQHPHIFTVYTQNSALHRKSNCDSKWASERFPRLKDKVSFAILKRRSAGADEGRAVLYMINICFIFGYVSKTVSSAVSLFIQRSSSSVDGWGCPVLLILKKSSSVSVTCGVSLASNFPGWR